MYRTTLAALLILSTTLGTALPQVQPSVSAKMVLQDGTPLKLRLTRNLSSADAKTGEQVDFEILEDIKIADILVVAKGGIAIGSVTEAQAKRRMGRGGKLNVMIEYVRLVNGEKAALRAVKEVAGGSKTGGMTAGIVATSLIVWPAAPFFLFMHGKDITIPKGTEITAYINGDMDLARSKFQPTGSAVAQTEAPTTPAAPAAENAATCCTPVLVSSTPAGAEIELDGSFVGSTPSIINMPAGDHQIVLKKKSFKSWERKIRSTGGSIKVEAELEPMPGPR